MKKFLLIAVLITYSIASYGLQFNYFYCFGKLKTVSLVSKTVDNFCKDKHGIGCCNTKTVSLKLTVDQEKSVEKAAVKLVVPQPLSVTHINNFIANNSISSYVPAPCYKINPLNNSLSRTILFCVFRI